MTKDEYLNKLTTLFNEYEFNRKSIMLEYALFNNEIEIGDIFIDHIGPIKVEKIMPELYGEIPSCSYYGLELKKDYSPKKIPSWRTAYQNNQVAIIKNT